MTSSSNLAKRFESEGLDVEALIGEVARRHNILISPDDPIFATITLNDLVLVRALERQQAALIAAQDQIVATTAQQIASVQRLAERLITAASEHMVTQVRNVIEEATAQNRNASAVDLQKAHQIVANAKHEGQVMRWGAGIAIATAAMFVTLMLAFPFTGRPSFFVPECKPALTQYLRIPFSKDYTKTLLAPQQEAFSF